MQTIETLFLGLNLGGPVNLLANQASLGLFLLDEPVVLCLFFIDGRLEDRTYGNILEHLF